MFSVRVRVLFISLWIVPVISDDLTALVTGATGRTGSLIYKILKEGGKVGTVRALVHNVTTARERLGCKLCDESEGIFLGDVTQPSSMVKAFAGVHLVANAVGVYGTEPRDTVKQVEFQGVKNQVYALAQGGVAGKRFVMISSMGSTDPPKANTNDVLFFKLNAEAFVESAGVPYAIVKPCGLNEDPMGQRDLMVGHDDSEDWFSHGFYMVPRADVAMVTAAALVDPVSDALRFDLCAKNAGSGPPKTSRELLTDALWPWERHISSASFLFA